MAILRSDQSQLTFAAEAAQGGDPEMNSGTRVTSGFHAELTADVPAGKVTLSGQADASFYAIAGLKKK